MSTTSTTRAAANYQRAMTRIETPDQFAAALAARDAWLAEIGQRREERAAAHARGELSSADLEEAAQGDDADERVIRALGRLYPQIARLLGVYEQHYG